MTENPRLRLLGSEVRETLTLAAPSVLAQLAQMSMSFVDTVMVGRLGPQPLASTALGGSIFFPITVICLGFLMGTGPMVSQAFGAGKSDSVGRAVRQGLWLAALLAIPATVALRHCESTLVALGQQPATAALTQEYLRAMSWGVLPLLCFGVLRSFVEGLARPRVVTVIAVGGVVLNILSNTVLMYGRLGFPRLGVVGCGLASAIVYWCMLAALGWTLARNSDYHPYRVFASLRKPDPEHFRELIRIGWPIAASLGLEVSFFGAAAFLMGLWGVIVLSAHQIALQCAAFAYMVPLGLSIATSVRVGHAVGRRDWAGARRAGWVGTAMGGAFMSLTGLIFWLAPRRVVSLFLDLEAPVNAEVADLAVTLLAFAALFQVFDGIQVNAMGALRGFKDTRVPMLIALVSYWGIGLGSGVLFAFEWKWSGPGLWAGLVLGLASAAVFLTIRFHRRSRPQIDFEPKSRGWPSGRGAGGAP